MSTSATATAPTSSGRIQVEPLPGEVDRDDRAGHRRPGPLLELPVLDRLAVALDPPPFTARPNSSSRMLNIPIVSGTAIFTGLLAAGIE
ncbi:MAG: hypothetical protein U0133_04350 [Gemmatimonadales bacterium]